MLLLIALVSAAPLGRVLAGRPGTWQFPYQHRIDQATFSKATLAMKDGPTLMSISDTPAPEAHYQFLLRFGPRS